MPDLTVTVINQPLTVETPTIQTTVEFSTENLAVGFVNQSLTVETPTVPLVLEFPANITGPVGVQNKAVSIAGVSGDSLVGTGSTSSFGVVHYSALAFPVVHCFEVSTGKEVGVGITLVSATELNLNFAIPPTSGETFKIVVL